MSERKPSWLRIRLPTGESYGDLKRLVHGNALHTVCEEARCPNVHECWARYRTASFLVLGDVCTRACRFCSVKAGRPSPVDEEEPRRVAESAARMGLGHVHVTMVTRDDLQDGG